MKIHCKCGECLTAHVLKTPYKEAIVAVGKKSYAGTDYTSDEREVKQGTYHKWKRNKTIWRRKKEPAVYVVSHKDLVEGTIVNTSKGCCNWDYFDVQCPSCKQIVGEGGNDCWQESKAMLICTKVDIKEDK